MATFQQLNSNSQDEGYDSDWLELLAEQTAEYHSQTPEVWAICCNNSGLPGVEAFVYEAFPSEVEAQTTFNKGNFNTSYWVQRVPHRKAQRLESTGEWL